MIIWKILRDEDQNCCLTSKNLSSIIQRSPDFRCGRACSHLLWADWIETANRFTKRLIQLNRWNPWNRRISRTYSKKCLQTWEYYIQEDSEITYSCWYLSYTLLLFSKMNMKYSKHTEGSTPPSQIWNWQANETPCLQCLEQGRTREKHNFYKRPTKRRCSNIFYMRTNITRDSQMLMGRE